MASTTLLSLPLSLVLLVHLHILEYPLANNPEYNHDVFNPRKRGLRERAQSMEDVAYFLVSKVEGKSVKMTLPTYPCKQPSESLAFRTSLSKYLESLRHQCIFPSSSHSRTPAKLKPSSKAFDGSGAWWWKDVVVRKSLLEECSGEKFERLMLSLSTHALMKASGTLSSEKMSEILRDQPMIYTTTLARYQAIRHAWAKAASTLLRSEHDLRLVRESLNEAASEKYASIPTERLQALVDSKLQYLLQHHWTDKEGKDTLISFIELAGLRSASASPTRMSSAQFGLIDASSLPPAIPAPLPIAAAHHPTQLKKLRKSIFQQPRNKSDASNGSPSLSTKALPVRSHAEVVLAPQIESEKRVHQALSDALARTKRVGEELRVKVDKLRREALSSASRRASGPTSSSNSSLFWTPSGIFQVPSSSDTEISNHIQINIDFEPKPTRELMLSLGLESEFDSLISTSEEGGQEDIALEKRIREIRVMLPPYPSLPDYTAKKRHPLPTTADDDSGPSAVKVSRLAQSETSGTKAKNVVGSSASTSASKPLPSQSSLPVKSTVPPLAVPTTPILPSSKSSEMRSIRRKSVRFSIAKRRSGRPSMFRMLDAGLEDEVDRLIDETHDFPTDDEDTDSELGNDDPTSISAGDTASAAVFFSSPLKTPKASRKMQFKHRTPVNRIWTAGTPKSNVRSKFQRQMRQSSSSLGRLLDSEPEVGLPGLWSRSAEADEGVEEVGVNLEDQHDGWGDDDDDEVAAVRDVDATPRPLRKSFLTPVSPKSDDAGEELDVFEEDLPSMTLRDILLSADTSRFELLDLSNEEVGDEMLADDTSFVWG